VQGNTLTTRSSLGEVVQYQYQMMAGQLLLQDGWEVYTFFRSQ